LEETVDVDDLFLRKVRKIIKSDNEDNDFYNINVPLMVIGTFLVVIGWSILNACGYGLHSLNSTEGRYSAEIAFLNTFISGSCSGFIAFLLKRHIVRGDHAKTPRYDIRSLCNGFLAGIAAVSAGSGAMKPWGALITGIIEGFLYMITCAILKKVKIDDAMENF
jgi:Amt family ammonium transporter